MQKCIVEKCIKHGFSQQPSQERTVEKCIKHGISQQRCPDIMGQVSHCCALVGLGFRERIMCTLLSWDALHVRGFRHPGGFSLCSLGMHGASGPFPIAAPRRPRTTQGRCERLVRPAPQRQQEGEAARGECEVVGGANSRGEGWCGGAQAPGCKG